MKPKAIICDLDGTLYDSHARQEKYLSGEKKNFDAFNADAVNDSVNVWCAHLVLSLVSNGYDLIFVSGREDKHFESTRLWLFHNLGLPLGNSRRFGWKLFMRKTGDYRPDVVIKEEIYRQHIESIYDISFAIDDRKSVVNMWRSLGLVCLQCAPGEF